MRNPRRANARRRRRAYIVWVQFANSNTTLTKKPRNRGAFCCMFKFMFYSLQQKISIAWVIQGDKMEERLRKHNSSHKGFTGHVGDWKVMKLQGKWMPDTHIPST